MFYWYCRHCREKCEEAIAKIDLLENQTKNLATKVTKLDDRVKEIEGRMTKNVHETIRSQLDERNDVERRKMNVGHDRAWYNKNKKKEDTVKFIEIASQALDIDFTESKKDVHRFEQIRHAYNFLSIY